MFETNFEQFRQQGSKCLHGVTFQGTVRLDGEE